MWIAPDHQPAVGWRQIEGKWYWFDLQGIMATGLITINSQQYFLNSSGAMCTGWKQLGSQWMYFDSVSGAAVHGWKLIEKRWYCFNEAGIMLTGWLMDAGSWYCLSGSGAMLTGWLQDGKDWYYLTENGSMKTGWLDLKDGIYYLSDSGKMLTGTQTIDGTDYVFDQNGRLKRDMEDLKKDIEACIAAEKNGSEDWQVSVINLQDQNMIEINNHPQQSASVMKLFVAACVYDSYDALSEKYGKNYIDNNLYFMITVSSNEAWTWLVSCLGNGSWGEGCLVLTNWCKEHGFNQTSSTGNLQENFTSVHDTALLMQDFWNDRLPGSQEILNLMKKQTRKWKLPQGIPDGIVTGNKTGELGDTENDVLVVWADTPYALSVMTTGVSYSAHAFQVMKDISAMVYQFLH